MTDRATWDPVSYAANTAHHRAYDDAVLSPIDIAPDARILDIGCGVGDLTARLAALAPKGATVGIDRSPEQVAHARASHASVANLGFATLSAEDVGGLGEVELAGGGTCGRPFDLVLSTATLHWLPASRHLDCYRGVHDLLRRGGAFRAEFGGQGQIAAVRHVLDEESMRLGGGGTPWFFPAPEEIAPLLAQAGLTIEEGFVRLVVQPRSFPDFDTFSGWMMSQSIIAYALDLPPGAWREFCARSLERLREEIRRDDGSYDLDFVRLDLLARRP